VYLRNARPRRNGSQSARDPFVSPELVGSPDQPLLIIQFVDF
jgi:hypothetical protein